MYKLEDNNKENLYSSTQAQLTSSQPHISHQSSRTMSNTIKPSSVHNTRGTHHTQYNTDYHCSNEEHNLSGKKRIRSHNNSIDTTNNKTHDNNIFSQTINLSHYHSTNNTSKSTSGRSGSNNDNTVKRARALTPEPVSISIASSTVKGDIDSDYITSDCSVQSSSSIRYTDDVDTSASKYSTSITSELDSTLYHSHNDPLTQSSRTSSHASVDTQLLQHMTAQYITAPITRSKSNHTQNNDNQKYDNTQSQQIHINQSRSVSDVTRTTRSRSTASLSTLCSVETIMLDLDPLQLEEMFISEKKYQPSKDYYTWQQHLEPSMRPILFDWLMEVSQEFHLGRETYHLACNYVDRYLSMNASTPAIDQQKQQLRTTRRTAKPGCIDDPNRTITRSNLQLLGVTCLSVAAKFEEIYPPSNNDFATTTDGAYTTQQIDLMERSILKTLQWNLHSVTTYTWLKMLVKAVTQRLALDYQIKYQQLNDSNNLSELKSTNNLLRAIELHVNDITQVLISINMFERTMILIDLASLDTHFLEYYPSAIAMSAFILIYVQNYNYYTNTQLFSHMSDACKQQWFTFPIDEYVSELTGYSIDILQQCITRLTPYLQLALIDSIHYPQRRTVTDQHLDELKIPKAELYGRQIHYTRALTLVQVTQQKLP